MNRNVVQMKHLQTSMLIDLIHAIDPLVKTETLWSDFGNEFLSNCLSYPHNYNIWYDGKKWQISSTLSTFQVIPCIFKQVLAVLTGVLPTIGLVTDLELQLKRNWISSRKTFSSNKLPCWFNMNMKMLLVPVSYCKNLGRL